jgi:N-acetyl-anhydromuramyl-L-alanine amidase AmpD
MKTLTLHSKGPAVAALQKFLHIKADGIFGPITFKHVRSWQSAFGLTSDGIVGPITYQTMIENGFVPHASIVLDGLEIEEYFLPKNAFFQNSTEKTHIFLHHTKGWENPYRVIDSWGRNAHHKVATEYVIGGQSIHNDNTEHDGKILQAIPNNGWAWHLGIGNQRMHRESIGIELCNFGYLTKGYFEKRVNGKLQSIERKKDSYYTYVGQEVHRDQIITLEQPFRGYNHCHKYSSKQIKVLKQLLEFLGNQHDIDIRKGLPDLIKKQGSKAFDKLDVSMCRDNPGIWSHTNVVGYKTDVIPQVELVEMLMGL